MAKHQADLRNFVTIRLSKATSFGNTRRIQRNSGDSCSTTPRALQKPGVSNVVLTSDHKRLLAVILP